LGLHRNGEDAVPDFDATAALPPEIASALRRHERQLKQLEQEAAARATRMEQLITEVSGRLATVAAALEQTPRTTLRGLFGPRRRDGGY